MIDRRQVTKALLALTPAATGLPCGDGAAPVGGVEPPYYVLYALHATYSGAPFADLHEDASLVYQWTCVSGPDKTRPGSRGSRDQAEWMADKVRRALLGRDRTTGAWLHPLTVPGAHCTGRSLDTEPGGRNEPADAIMGYDVRIRFDLTAA
ncbi:MAG TPA: hypothetical protein VFY14_06650 [Streptomyces sp.]|nr:hypothetical protein [Streptomyces sp.]